MKALDQLKARKVSNRLAIATAVTTLLVVLIVGRGTFFPGGWGLGEDTERTITVERNGKGAITKRTVVRRFQSGKTVWDWWSVLGVPLTLAALGFGFQWLQQRQADKQTQLEKAREDKRIQLEKDIAESNQKEEAIQAYFDRISALLVDKNLLAVASKDSWERGVLQDEEKDLLDASVDVIRARTLSILRRLGDDAERKTSVIQFLIEAEVISKLGLSLKGADLSNADLRNTDLYNVNLSDANLYNADFSYTNLRDVNLHDAYLISAVLISADLRNANLSSADLNSTVSVYANFCNANLNYANFCDANLISVNLSGANLSNAILIRANLSNALLDDADLDSADLQAADLYNASLLNARLKGSDLTGADLSTVKNWEEVQLSSALLCETKLPEGCCLNPNRDCKKVNKLLDV